VPPGFKAIVYDPADADVNAVYDRDHELFPDEWTRNVFDEETERQKKNWAALNKERNKLGKNPQSWPGEPGLNPGREICRAIVRDYKWTAWSIRPTDLGYDSNGNVKSCLKEKLRDIGYPELIRRKEKMPEYETTRDVFLTNDTWERLVAGKFIHTYPLQTVNSQWVPMWRWHVHHGLGLSPRA
jgi:hypothetical protein